MPRTPSTRLAVAKKKRRKWFIIVQTWLNMCATMSEAYFARFVKKTRLYDSVYTGNNYMMDLLHHKSDTRCLAAFRMEMHVFFNLCNELEAHYGLRPSINMTVIEKVGIFLTEIALALNYTTLSERFQRSGDTISRSFHEVLNALVGRANGFDGMVRRLIKPRDPTFKNIPNKIVSDARYGLFEGAIGAIDGTHIKCVIPRLEQFPYRGRKGFTSFNVMAVCDFDMFFTYTSVGWEGSAHDTRVLDHALNTPGMNFPLPPPDRYYLCDKGYPDRQGYMVPYSKVRYHQSQFKRDAPRNVREGFNRVHSSLRTTIERCFGVLKKRWKVLEVMPSFSVTTQIDIISTCFALHNFILENRINDASFEDQDLQPEVIYGPEDAGVDHTFKDMTSIRDEIAKAIWANKKRYLGKM